MGVEKTMIPVLAVALITWVGIFFYLMRLDVLSRKLERQARELPSREPSSGFSIGPLSS